MMTNRRNRPIADVDGVCAPSGAHSSVPGLRDALPNRAYQQTRWSCPLLFAKRGRQIIREGTSGVFRRTTCRENGVELEWFHLPVGQHLHERAACELRTAVPKGHYCNA